MVNVAILGYGVVGSGVYKVINDNNSHVSRRAGEEIRVKYVLDLREFPGDPAEDVLVHDFDVILNDEEVDIIGQFGVGFYSAFMVFCSSSKNLAPRPPSICT